MDPAVNVNLSPFFGPRIPAEEYLVTRICGVVLMPLLVPVDSAFSDTNLEKL